MLESMGRFASAAYQTVESIEELKSEVVAREKAEAELRELTDSLERQVRARTRELEHRNEALAKARSELAHATRITGLGVLTASIAHEVNQPLAVIAMDGELSLRLLTRDEPEIEKYSGCSQNAWSPTRGGRPRSSTASATTATSKRPSSDLLSLNDVIRN